MDLNIFSTLSFLPALHTFFEKLNIPIHHVADEPTTAKEILIENYKENDTFALTNDVYFVGMVDDAAFAKREATTELKDIKTDYDGILIFGVTLHERPNGLLPTRTQLAEIARAFNREFYYTPVVVVFKYSNHIAFANTERLQYKQEWREGEKAGKVTLLRDVNIEKPHAGHERILAELKIPTTGRDKVDSFAKLYTYWQEVLSVNILNKKFYQELSNWYFWAIQNVQFPGKPTLEDAIKINKDLDDLKQEHKATNVIRMLTRLLFVWFLKEKKLIPDELFDLKSLQKDILNKIDPIKNYGVFKEENIESVYYKAILQNLFFATLNCPIEGDSIDKRKRGFRKGGSSNYGTLFLMRYEEYFKDKDGFLSMVNQVVPFLNGGLFECLDERGEDEKRDERKWIDGFSDNLPKDQQLVVPDYLFFGKEENTDLSEIVGIDTIEYKQADVKGLINILESYKFTIAENTPIEEDVALDPELLGKVFENLLASYNPETKTTARKQTGSFYTPREIVNYMVDESLIAYLSNAIDTVSIEEVVKNQDATESLRQLVSFDPVNPFDKDKDKNLTKEIITALSTCTIIDPACGSGAFPMGILQKMVHILQKLDPDNKIWKEVQREKANSDSEEAFDKLEDKNTRAQRLIEINEAFDERVNDPDYARKLFLIENCIYGVDIQPIATQISKLRFFISLVVEQNVNPEKENFGIRPLPNLETKFVAANTLIGIDKPKKGDQLGIFTTEKQKKLETELKIVRSKLFSAKTRPTKVKYRKQDEELRNAIAAELLENGWESATAQKLAKWDPYDQNASSDFFNPEWMFDIKDGFDVVIGNPPYVLLQERIKKEVDINLIRNTFRVASYKVDLYHLFYEKGISLLSDEGVLTYITPTNFLLNNYTVELRKIILETNLNSVLLLKNSVFEASVDTSVFVLIKNGSSVKKYIKFIEGYVLNEKLDLKEKSKIKRSVFCKDDFVINPEFDDITLTILKKIERDKRISDVATVNFGMQLRNRKEYLDDVIQTSDKSLLSEFHEKCYTGRDIKEFQVLYNNRYCYFNTDAKRGGCWNEKVQFAKNKILVPQVGKFPVAGIDNKGYPVLNTAFLIVPEKQSSAYSLQAIINSSLIRYYWLNKFYDQRQSFPKIKGTYLKEIPLPDDYTNINISILSQLIFFNIDLKVSIIRDVLEGLVLELYLSKHMIEQNINIKLFVEQDIDTLLNRKKFELFNSEEKENLIEQLYEIWSDPNNEVVKRIGMFREKSPDLLGVILDSELI